SWTPRPSRCAWRTGSRSSSSTSASRGTSSAPSSASRSGPSSTPPPDGRIGGPAGAMGRLLRAERHARPHARPWSAMTVEETLREAETKMKAAVSVAQDELASLRTGRANARLLDRVLFEYYGTQTPLKQMATFSVPEPRLLVIQPFDKNAI